MWVEVFLKLTASAKHLTNSTHVTYCIYYFFSIFLNKTWLLFYKYEMRQFAQDNMINIWQRWVLNPGLLVCQYLFMCSTMLSQCGH